jgi:soluble lytic murein transglycosylase-like protein
MSIKILSSINDAYLSQLESAKKSSGSDTGTSDSFADALAEAQETLASSELTDAEKNAIRALTVDAAVSAIKQSGGYGLSIDSELAQSLGVSVVSTGQAEASSTVPTETAEEAAARFASKSSSSDETQDTENTEETQTTSTYTLSTGDIETYSVDSDNLNCSDTLLSYFKEAAETYNVDEKLLRSFAFVESDFDPSCTSSAGAMGVMQLMPETATELGVDDPYDAYENITGGAKLISQLLEKYDGDISLTAAAYNAGSGAVAKAGGIPSYTEAYVKKVLSYYCS